MDATNVSEIDQDFAANVDFWMNGIFSLILVLMGLCGNTAAVLSFHCYGEGANIKRRRHQAFYFYLMTFAVWNTGLLVATVFFNCIPSLVPQNVSSRLSHWIDVSYLFGYLAGNCCVTANVWLAVTVTVERYWAVIRPLHIRLTSPRRRAKFICITLSFLVLVYNSPLVFELQFSPLIAQIRTELNQTENNVSSDYGQMANEYKLHLSDMRDNTYYQFVYRVVGHFLFVSFVPFTIILLLTIKIVCVVRESDRNRAYFRKPGNSGDFNSNAFLSGSSLAPFCHKQRAHSRQADVILTLTAAKFLIFYSLPVIVNIMELTMDQATFHIQDGYASKVLLLVVNSSNLLIVLDGATNSFFYFSWRNRARTPRPVDPSKSGYALVNVGPRHGLGTGENSCSPGQSRSGSRRQSQTPLGKWDQEWAYGNELRPPAASFSSGRHRSSVRTTFTDL